MADSRKLEEIKPDIVIEDDGNGGRVLTVYFMGTAARKGDKNNFAYFPRGELVASTLDKTLGEKNVDFVFANGPGTDANDVNAALDEYDNGERSDRNERWAKPTSSSFLRQMLRGDGIRENIDHLIAVINGERKWWPDDVKIEDRTQPLAGRKLPPITKVNFLGWSRGAAGSMEAANRIYDLQQAIIKTRKRAVKKGKSYPVQPIEHIKEINICAIDPVAGFGSVHTKNKRLPRIVKNYRGFYALDERSFGFSPIFPTTDPNSDTRMQFDFFPGHHCTLVGSDKLHDGKMLQGTVQAANGEVQSIDLSSVGDIIRDSAEKYLMQHGTRLDGMRVCNYSRKDLLELYEKIKLNMPAYEKLRNGAYTFTQMSDYHHRKFVHGNTRLNITAHQIPEFVEDEKERKNGYVNRHHAELMRADLKEKYGDKYAVYIEHLQKIKYQIQVYLNYSNITKHPSGYQHIGDFTCFFKNKARRTKERKAAAQAMIGMIDEFITHFSQDNPVYFSKFSQQIKRLVQHQLSEIKQEKNLYQSDYGKLLQTQILENAPWSPTRSRFGLHSKAPNPHAGVISKIPTHTRGA